MARSEITYQQTLALLLLCLCATAFADDSNLAEGDLIRNEKQCAYQGGICTMKDDCDPNYLTAVKGLCPNQQHKGVECCYSTPISAKSCSSQGGECTSKENCGNAPMSSGKCFNGEVCCIYVK